MNKLILLAHRETIRDAQYRTNYKRARKRERERERQNDLLTPGRARFSIFSSIAAGALASDRSLLQYTREWRTRSGRNRGQTCTSIPPCRVEKLRRSAAMFSAISPLIATDITASGDHSATIGRNEREFRMRDGSPLDSTAFRTRKRFVIPSRGLKKSRAIRNLRDELPNWRWAAKLTDELPR